MSQINILIVDDDYSSRVFIKKIIEKDGYNPFLAEDGLQALELIKKQKFKLIISDLKMVGLDGLELLEKVKKVDPNIGVIILTGYASVQTAIEALRLGAIDYLTKPVNIEEMKIRIKKALERQELENRLTEIERRITYNATVTTANHEINQPLTVILSGIDMIKMELDHEKITNLKLRNYFQLIQKASLRIANILRRLREITSPVIQEIPHGMKMIELKPERLGKPDKDRFILVIEDEENIRHIIKELLENEGYRVILASDAKEGIEIYKTRTDLINLILLDYYLPDGKGKEVYRKLNQINADANVIITSGFEFEEDIQQVLEEGALGFLSKPFDRKQILSIVKSVSRI